MIDELTFLVLNAIYLRKITTRGLLREGTALDADAIKAALDRAIDTGQVIDMGGQFMLQEEGTKAVLEFYVANYGSLRDDQDLVQWYDRFETVNGQFLKVVSEWQKSEGDDERLLGRLTRAVERHVAAIERIVALIPRYDVYVSRFTAGLDRVDQGQRAYVTGPTVDSLHSIWFEFHEDILGVLGRPRDTVKE